MLAVAAGLSLGKEGPMVHIAICLGNIIITHILFRLFIELFFWFIFHQATYSLTCFLNMVVTRQRNAKYFQQLPLPEFRLHLVPLLAVFSLV